MASTQNQIVAGVLLTSTAASVYTVPNLTTLSITATSVNNPTANTPQTVNIYRVPSGGSADDSTIVAKLNVNNGTCAQIYGTVNVKAEAGTQIYADGDGCYLNMSGILTV